VETRESPGLIEVETYQEYQKAGLEVALIEVTGANHVFRQVISGPIPPSMDEIKEIVLVFFIEHPLCTR